MFNSRVMGALAALLMVPVGATAATTYPTFVVDGVNSSISITQTGGSTVCNRSCLRVRLVRSLDGRSFTPTATGDMTRFGFARWRLGTGFASDMTFAVSATLAFSRPNATSTSTNGTGQVLTVNGLINRGTLNWNSAATSVAFTQGSMLGVRFQGGAILQAGTSRTSGVKLSAKHLVPVPVPMALPMLAGGVAVLGGLGLWRRKRRKS